MVVVAAGSIVGGGGGSIRIRRCMILTIIMTISIVVLVCELSCSFE